MIHLLQVDGGENRTSGKCVHPHDPDEVSPLLANEDPNDRTYGTVVT